MNRFGTLIVGGKEVQGPFTFGGGFVDRVRDHVRAAIAKHPDFITPTESEFQILIEEVGEIASATAAGDEEQRKREILDAIAVLIRMYYNHGR